MVIKYNQFGCNYTAVEIIEM